MRVVGFNFTKISIERLNDRVEKIKFNTKMDILSIESLKSDFFKTKEELLKVDFAYSINYEPEFARLEFKGNLIIAAESKISKEILKDWKDKKIPDDFKIFIFNIIFKKVNIKALQLEDELAIPSHIPLPSINKKDPQEGTQEKETKED